MIKWPDARLLIFAKAPQPGKAKTRLIPHHGPHGAVRIYQSLLYRTLCIVTTPALCPVELWCAPDSQHGFFTSCRRQFGVTLKTQHGRHLGARMQYALAAALKRSSFAVLIGSDCASIDTKTLQSALTALAEGQDAVLGPAEDGGYVLIGLRQSCPMLFHGIDWGGARVLAATRQRLRRAGLKWTELPPGWDVDRPADVCRFKRIYATSSAPKDSEV